jgi:hypothetical protein
MNINERTFLNLDNVTIISVAGVRGKESLKAIEYSKRSINFKSCKLLTPEKLESSSIEIIKINPINYAEYNKFIVYDLYKYIDTDYALIIQDDGFITNPECWTNDFLKYDYVGAPWILPRDSFSYRDIFGNIIRVGNGGFSLRSKKLLSIASELDIPWKSYYGFYNEDGFIACHNRHIYEKEGCKFAPLEVAVNFSKELEIDENINIKTFGTHGVKNAFN